MSFRDRKITYEFRGMIVEFSTERERETKELCANPRKA